MIPFVFQNGFSRKETGHIFTHKLVSRDWRLHCIFGLKSDILPALTKREFQDQHCSKGKVVPTQEYEFDDWSSQEIHHVCFKAPVVLKTFQIMYIDSNISAKEFGTAATLTVKRCLILFGFFKSNLFGLCPMSCDKATTTPQNFPPLAARKPKMMWFHQRMYLGNRKRERGILQLFPNSQLVRCQDQISNADFGVWCLPFNCYQFQWGISSISGDCCIVSKAYSIILHIILYPCKVQTLLEGKIIQIRASQGRQSGGRRMPRSQTVVFVPSLRKYQP